jgi:hypothetical protein
MKASIDQRWYTCVYYAQKVFTLASPKSISMRAIDAKILEELEMLYGDKGMPTCPNCKAQQGGPYFFICE